MRFNVDGFPHDKTRFLKFYFLSEILLHLGSEMKMICELKKHENINLTNEFFTQTTPNLIRVKFSVDLYTSAN